MEDIKKSFDVLESVIKIEPEEFQEPTIDDILRARAKIFTEPIVHVERFVYKIQTFDSPKSDYESRYKAGETAEMLAMKGNEGLRYNERHSCCICQKVFSNHQKLVGHLERIHCKSTRIICDLCPKFFFTRGSTLQHMRIHKKKSYECNVCDYKTAIKADLKSHILVHAAKVECPICKKKVSSLKNHMQYHKPKKSCPVCQKMFTKDGMRFHMTIHERTYECEKCDENFRDKEALRSHNVVEHSDTRIFRCYCGSAFKSKKLFKSHEESHNEKKTCGVCQKQFTSRSFKSHWSKKHLKTHGRLGNNKTKVLNRSGPFICDKCGSKYFIRKSFQSHYNLYHVSGLLSCDLCPRSFNKKGVLVLHIKSHFKSDLNPHNFECSVCSFKSSYKRSLKTHMLVHGPKTECKICQKFVSNINVHKRSHATIKCTICGEISSKTMIAYHMKSQCSVK